MINSEQKNIIKHTLKKYNPSVLGVFGSYARNEQKKESDLDLLVDFNQTLNLLDLIGLEQELSEKLGVKVDLITTKSLNKNIKPYIEKDLISII